MFDFASYLKTIELNFEKQNSTITFMNILIYIDRINKITMFNI